MPMGDTCNSLFSMVQNNLERGFMRTGFT
jgi:hypothetical protein